MNNSNTPNPANTKVYDKAASILSLAGGDEAQAAVLARLREFYDQVYPDLGLDQTKREVLNKVEHDLFSAPDGDNADDKTIFRLRPHVVEELQRIRDDELVRYLHYRYRYDVYPFTHQVDAYPPCVQIEPTSVCNYRCVFCYQTDKSFSQKREGHMGMMSLDTFKAVVDEIQGNVEAVTLASRGDPLIAPEITPMLEYISGKFLGLKINTNAWALDEEKAHAILAAEPNTVVFSADAADADLYAKLRVGGKLDRVLENIRRFQEIRVRDYPQSRTITRVSGVRFSEEQNFEDLEAFWHDHVDQVAFVDYNPWVNSYDQPSNGLDAPCSDLWRRAFVWWDGKVNPCDVDYKSHLQVGSIGGQTLSKLWNGDGYRDMREKHLSGARSSISPCLGCAVV